MQNEDSDIQDSDPDLFQQLEKYQSTIDRSLQEDSAMMLSKNPGLANMFQCLERLDQLAQHVPRGDDDVDASTYISANSLNAEKVSNANQLGEFGDYELIEEIGRGGMGVVYRAHQKSLDREVALKMILSSRFAGREELHRFQQEAKAAAKLKHENIVRVFEVGEHAGQHFFTMEYIEGGSLSDLIESGPQTAESAVQIINSIAHAVHYLHENGIIHRDLKPSNILIDANGKAHVTDFGLAKFTDGVNTQTASGAIIGTPSYMSPEQASGRTREIGPHSDVYGLGALFYSVLTGRPPFREENPLDTLVQVIESEPPSPSSLRKGIPRPLEKICLHSLEKNIEDRYQSASLMADDLERFLRGEEPEIDAASFGSRFLKWTRREPGLASRLAAIIAAVLVVEIRFLFLGGDPWFHVTVLIIFSIWAITSCLCQQLLNLQHSASDHVPFVWVLADVVLLTWVLSISEPPIGTLLIGYPTLVVAAGMWFRTSLVWFMTCCSLTSYASLLYMRPENTSPPHYPILYAAVLSVIGYMVAHQIQRVRALSRYYEHRKL